VKPFGRGPANRMVFAAASASFASLDLQAQNNCTHQHPEAAQLAVSVRRKVNQLVFFMLTRQSQGERVCVRWQPDNQTIQKREVGLCPALEGRKDHLIQCD
jgi:hypothetical protein